MKFKAVFAVTLLLAVAVAAIAIPAEETDAANILDIKLKKTSYEIEDGDDITLTLIYNNDSINYPSTVEIYSASNPDKVLYSERVEFMPDIGGEQELNITFEPSKSGTLYIRFVDTEVHSDMSFKVSFTESIWSDWKIYAAIVVIIILIVVLIAYKSRTSTPKEKNAVSFEQLEAQRQAQKAAPKEKKSAPVKSERQRYLESKKK